MDRENILLTKWLDGKEEGLAEGREAGLAEGREAGLAEGLDKGQEAERRRSAAQYKKLGVAPEIIAEVTGFTIEEIAAM